MLLEKSPDPASLDWSDDEIDFNVVHPDDPVEHAESQKAVARQRAVFTEVALPSLSHTHTRVHSQAHTQAKPRTERAKLFRGDVKSESQRVLPAIPLSVPLSQTLSLSHSQTHSLTHSHTNSSNTFIVGSSLSPSPALRVKTDSPTDDANTAVALFPDVPARLVAKLSRGFLSSVWAKYKSIVSEPALSIEDSLLAVSAFPALISFVNRSYQQSLCLEKIERLRELEKDDFYEFAMFIAAIEPFLDASRLDSQARGLPSLPLSNPAVYGDVDGRTPRSTASRTPRRKLSARRRSRPTSSASSRPLSASSAASSSSSRHTMSSARKDKDTARAAGERAAQGQRACCALPACLCGCRLPAALLTHMQIESDSQGQAREEVDFSETMLHRLQMSFSRLLLSHRGQLRIKHVAPLLQELSIPCHAYRLPQHVWDLYDSFFIDSFESFLTLVRYLTAEEPQEKDPLAHLYKYPLPDWLKNEFTPAEILLFQHQFGLIDIDGGGSVDAGELQLLLSAFDSPVTLEEAQAIVDKYDIDGSGTVDFIEFMILIYKIQRGTLDLIGNDLAQAVMEAKSQIRIFEEIEEVNLNPPELVEVGHFGGRVVVCQFRIHGPPGTVFEDRVIPCQMTFLEGYPYRPPDLLFHCRLFHINVANQVDGKARLLHLSQVWGSDWTIVKLLTHIIDVLRTPAASLLPKPYDELYDMLEKEYGKMMREQYTKARARGALQDVSLQGISQELLHPNSSMLGSSLETISAQSVHYSQSTVLPQEIKDKFQKLNRVQTMHMSVLYLYLFDPSAYTTLARTTGKTKEEMAIEDGALF